MRIISAVICSAYLAGSTFTRGNGDPQKHPDPQKEQESGRNLVGRSLQRQTEVKVNDIEEVVLAERNDFEEIVVGHNVVGISG